MASDQPQIPGGVDRAIGDVVSAVRWTLGNLDEAFRACLNSIEPAPEEAGHGELVPAVVRPARFRSCEGPIADGESGEGDPRPAVA